MNASADAVPLPAVPGRTVFGQPRGIATLFLTEMWERFTYYGMRALLITFMAAAVTRGGLGIHDTSASAIYGLYLGSTYLLGLAGGWMADHLLGSQRAVITGGFFIMVGNALLALGNTAVFFVGLLVIAMGVGLLKPNVSALVASLYPEGGARRDAGFSIFYMGINLGAFIGSQLVPWFAHWFGWHWGFALPAVGMAIGIAQFRLTRGYLNDAGLPPPAERRGSWTAGDRGAGASWPRWSSRAVSGALPSTRWRCRTRPPGRTRPSGSATSSTSSSSPACPRSSASRAWVMVALFAGSVMFFAGYEQQGASFNLFADRYTNLHVLGLNIPSGVLQAVNPFFVITLAPVLAALWIALGRRGIDLPAPVKFGLGPDLPGPRVPGDVLRLAARAGRADGEPGVARGHLPAALPRGAVPLAGRAVLHEQARPAALRRPGDGHVVPVDGAGQQHRRPALGHL